MSEGRKRLIYLDIIRVFALVCVFVVHFTRQFEFSGIDCGGYKILPDYPFGVYLGSLGVSLFFLTSGASLMYVYEKKCDLITYIKRRFFGILPMYWIAFVAATLYQFYSTRQFQNDSAPWTILLSLCGLDGYLEWYIPSFHVIGDWFLGCIILIYCLFPLLRIGIIKKPRITIGLSLIVYVLGGIFFRSAMPPDALFLLRVPEILFGMCFVYYFGKVKSYVAAIAAVFLAFCAIGNFTQVPTIWLAPPVGIAAFLVLTYCSEWLGRSLAVVDFSTMISKYCYAIFLTHHIVIVEVFGRFQNYGRSMKGSEVWLLFFVCIFVTAVLSGALYRVNVHFCNGLKKIPGKEKK